MNQKKKSIRVLNLVDLIYEIHSSMHRLENIIHKNGPLGELERSVLFELLKIESASVPMFARKKFLSRQRIQQVMNSLEKQNLVSKKKNPIHLKSSLYFLTPKGKRLGLGLLTKEIRIYKSFENQFTTKELDLAVTTLNQFKLCVKKNMPS